MQHRGNQCHTSQQKNTVPHIGESRPCSIINIGLGSHDFRDHGQTTHAGSDQIADTDRQDVSIHAGFSFPGIDQIDGFGTQNRFEAANDEEHHHPLPGNG